MYQNKVLENLELKLAQNREENLESFEKIEKNFKEEYSSFLEKLFLNDNSGIKKIISAYFQLEKIDNPERNNSDIFQNSLKKAMDNMSLNNSQKEELFLKVSDLEKKKEFFDEKLTDNSDITKDPNFPILEILFKKGILSQHDLAEISIKYKESKNFLDSTKVIEQEKFEIIKNHYFHLNDTKADDRISSFKTDFHEEIKNSNNIMIYPRVLSFIGKNYFKLRLKNKVESKTERLRRMFKIAFLKLYRLKYSGIDISEVLKKLETLDDLDSMISLLIKFFEELKQNPILQKDYVVSDEVEEVEDLVNESESNKEKTLFAEDKIVKASTLLEETEKKLTNKDLEKIFSEEVDLIGDEFVDRTEKDGILAEKKEEDLEKKEEKEEIEEDDLVKIFEEQKEKLFELEEEKRKLFLEGNYDEIDNLNDELINILKKIKKLKKLLNISEDE